MKKLFIAGILALTWTAASQAEELLVWNFLENAVSNPATAQASYIAEGLDPDVSVLTRGPEVDIKRGKVTDRKARGFYTSKFPLGRTIHVHSDAYFQFQVRAQSGQLSLSSIASRFSPTNTAFVGTEGAIIQYAYSLDKEKFTLIGEPVTVKGKGKEKASTIQLSDIEELQNVPEGTTVTFRLFASGNQESAGFGYDSVNKEPKALVLNGEVISK